MKERRKITLEQVAFWLLCVIMFDCTALGGGSIIELFGIDFRMILFVLFFIVSLPAVLKNFKGIITNGYVVLLLLWGVWTVICTIRGILAGNDISRILSAWIGFASFVLLPGMICVLKNKEQILSLMKVVAAAGAFVAVQTLLVLMVYNFLSLETLLNVNWFMIQEELGGCTGVNDAIVRIFFRSHPLVVTSCAVSLGLAMMEHSKKKQLLYCANIAVCLLSLLISFTRSVYLCVFVAVVVVIIAIVCFAGKVERKKMTVVCAKSVGLFLSFLLVCDVVFGGAFLSYGLYRTTGVDVMNKVEVSLGMENGALGGGFGLILPDEEPDSEDKPEDEPEDKPEDKPEEKPTTNEDGEFDPAVDINAWSDNIRQLTVAELYARIKEHPIVGSGMGATLDVRAGLDGKNEYFYLDMTFKTGVIGTFLYVAPMILLVWLLLAGQKRMDKETLIISATWLAGLLGIAAFSALNPYLNGSNGIVLYCCTIGVFTALNPKRQITK